MHIQGHRGARGNRPENTLPAIEYALDCLADSIETDLQITADGQVVLFHDANLFSYDLGQSLGVNEIHLAALRQFADRPLLLKRLFPKQKSEAGPLTLHLSTRWGISPWTIPTLADLFNFVEEYSGEGGKLGGKTPAQIDRAGGLILDLEVKQIPYLQMNIGPILQSITTEINKRNWAKRVIVRSFDHGVLKMARDKGVPAELALLTDDTIPHDLLKTLVELGAKLYCPRLDCVNEGRVKFLRQNGIKVFPWTLNSPQAWDLAYEWGVDGITTDFPGELKTWVEEKSGIKR